MSTKLPDPALDQLFRTARTRNGWQLKPVPEPLIREMYELAKWGPTSANTSPARFVFLTSQAAKQRLEPHLSGNNKAKTMAAPVVAIIAYDLAFAEKLPVLFPHAPGMKDYFAAPGMAEETAFRNGTLQGGYLMMAARSLGLDCGPMSGFDRAGVDREFLGGTMWRSNFLCSIGYGSDENLFPRNPRLPFEEACRTL